VTESAPVDAAAQSAAGAATTERVVVTGSYIPTAETESALPVTVYTATVLQKQGANTPVEGLRQLPSFVGNAATENDSNGGNGAAFINLRAMGTENTLTLINGRRAFALSNINAIPIGALSRSEVLKEGASAVYGSDAVAGVVNFILLNGPGEAPYEGAEFDFLYGNTTDTDSRVLQTYIRGGVATDKVSIAAAAQYYDRDGLFSRDREVSASADRRFLGGNNGGSPTLAGRVSARTLPSPYEGAPLVPGSSTETFILTDSTNNNVNRGSYRIFNPPAGIPGGGTDPEHFNFRAYTPAIPPIEIQNLYATGRYKIFGEALQVYGDVFYGHSKQDNGLAPSPFSLGLAVSNRSPFNPFFTGPVGGAPTATNTDDQLRSIAYRLVNELGNRRSFYDLEYFRYVVGFNGNFDIKDSQFISNFGYDTGLVYETSDQIRTDSGDAQRPPLEDAIDGIDLGGPALTYFNPFIGQAAPTSGVAPTYTNGVQTGTLAYDNQAVVDNAAFVARTYSPERHYLIDAKIFGNLFPGLYQGGVGFNIGYEHRNDEFEQFPDPTQEAGNQLGFNAGARYDLRTEVDSWFGEVRIPLITSTMNIPWAKSLEISFAYRFEEFEHTDLFNKGEFGTATFDNGGNPRISLRYQPTADVTLRASWGQSFLAPSAFQVFNPPAQNFPALFDIFANTTLQPPGGVFQQGTIGLRPEETDSYSAGIVYTPKWLPGFTMTVDWYQAYTTSLIVDAAETAQLLLTRNSLSLAPLFAANPGIDFNDPSIADVDLDGPGLGIFPSDFTGDIGGPGLGVTRGPNGTVQEIDSATTNAGKRFVQGMDITAAYQLPWTNFGTFTFSTGYNYFFTWKAEAVPGAGTHSFLGDYNNGTIPLAPGALPYHKGFLRGEWAWKGFDFVATGNYISSFNDDSAFYLATDAAGQQIARPIYGSGSDPQYPFYRRVTDYMTLDMQLRYEFVKPEIAPVDTKGFSKDGKSAVTQVAGADNSTIWQRMLWGTTLRIGVNNAFDRTVPSVLGAFNDNYDTSLYSIRNRYWYVGINKKF
jgi:iron complex outermembrane receptor protein